MKSKKERALEISIEQGMLRRGSEKMKTEFLSDIASGKPRSSLYTKIRLKLMLQWQGPEIK